MSKSFFLPLLFLLAGFDCFAQQKTSLTFSLLQVPAEWGKETFPLPVSFAPTIDFVGTEEVAFAPHWADQASPEFWTYAFAWRLRGNVALTPARLTELMEQYYSGLARSTGKDKGIAADRITKAQASFTAARTAGEWQNFAGKVQLFDAFFTQNQLILQVKAKSMYCPAQNSSLVVFFLSPQPVDHPVWQLFDAVRTPVDCQAFRLQTPE